MQMEFIEYIKKYQRIIILTKYHQSLHRYNIEEKILFRIKISKVFEDG